MQRKKMFWIGAAAVAGLVVVLLLNSLLGRQEKMEKQEGMLTEEAARALALSVADETEITKRAGKGNYTGYLMMKGYFLEIPDRIFTRKNLEEFAEKEKLHPEGVQRHIQGKEGQAAVSKEQFWAFYERWVLTKNPEIVKTVGVAAAEDELHLYLKEETLWAEGYDAGELLDQKITYYKKNGVLVGVRYGEAGKISYENVLVTDCEDRQITLFLYGGFRTFSFPGMEKMYQDAVLDVKIENRKVEEVNVKSEEIRAKVLSVNEQVIELEGYGELPFADSFMMYKGYGNYALQQKQDINIGYDIQKFFVAEGKICAGLTTHTLEAKSIRVLLTTTDFASRFHQEVGITCEDAFTVSWGEEQREYPGGTELVFSKDSLELQEGRVKIQPARESFPLMVTSITRNGGIPAYVGTLEMKQYEEGIVLLNEVLVEDYLLQVVPSEMPASFHPEALKVQAITARTYAIRGIEENACWEYGAHVDDSENFQVYANVASQSETEAAVRGTYGQVLKYGEEMAVIYYFSTSCGATTGPEIWGGSLTEVPYMEPKWIGTQKKTLDLTTEEGVREYFSSSDESAYEKDCQWFRWNTQLSLAQLSQSVNENLADRQKVNPALILVKEGDTYQQREITSIGTVEQMEVTARGSGGTVEQVRLTGSEAEILISGQTNIRMLLGSADCIYETVTGPSDTYRSMLQSSFFYLEEMEGGYRIVGGGKGHGLGMPQNAVNQMACTDMKAEDILEFFFTGTQLLSIY